MVENVYFVSFLAPRNKCFGWILKYSPLWAGFGKSGWKGKTCQRQLKGESFRSFTSPNQQQEIEKFPQFPSRNRIESTETTKPISHCQSNLAPWRNIFLPTLAASLLLYASAIKTFVSNFIYCYRFCFSLSALFTWFAWFMGENFRMISPHR